MKNRIHLDNLVTRIFNLVFRPREEDWDNFWKQRVVRGNLIELDDPFQRKVYRKTHKKLMTIFGCVEGKSIAEIGAGSGYASMLLAQEGATAITLVDSSTHALQYGRSLAEKLKLSSKIEFILADCRHLPLKSDSFDIVHSTGLVEHFGDQDILRILTECRRIMREDAKIAMTVPNFVSLEILTRIVKSGGKGTERHLSKSSLERLLGLCKFENIKVQSAGASVLPSYLSVKVDKLSKLVDRLAPFDYLQTVWGAK